MAYNNIRWFRWLQLLVSLRYQESQPLLERKTQFRIGIGIYQIGELLLIQENPKFLLGWVLSDILITKSSVNQHPPLLVSDTLEWM